MTAVESGPKPHVPTVLYHYTCAQHGEAGIRRNGKVLPHYQPLLGYPLLWLTDLDTPDMWALGLTNYSLCCNRTEVRVSVAPHDDSGNTLVAPWWHFARDHVDRFVRDLLEDKGLPLRWWVSLAPVKATGMIATSVLSAHARQREVDHA